MRRFLFTLTGLGLLSLAMGCSLLDVFGTDCCCCDDCDCCASDMAPPAPPIKAGSPEMPESIKQMPKAVETPKTKAASEEISNPLSPEPESLLIK